MKHYIVEIEDGVWLAIGQGDPARTLVKANSRVYGSLAAARGALTRARKYRRFEKAKIIPVEATYS